MNHTRRHQAAEPETPAVSVETLRHGVTGDARLVAGGTVTDQARAGGHAIVVGRARITDQAVITDRAVVAGDATVCEHATVSGHAAVTDQALVAGHAWAFGSATVTECATVTDQAQVFGAARVRGAATVTGQAWIFGTATIDGRAWIGGRARVGGGHVTGTARIDGDVRLRPGALVGDHAHLTHPGHLLMLELAPRVPATLYRCDAGQVGAGLPDGWHGLLDPADLPEELVRHSRIIDTLAEQWALEDTDRRLHVIHGGRSEPTAGDDGLDAESVNESERWAWAPPPAAG